MAARYQDIILTDHADYRQSYRSLTKQGIYQAIHQPDKKIRIEQDKWKFIKTINGRPYHVIASFLPNKQKWLVISVWVRGEDDRPPLLWKLITLPFKLLWWVINTVWKSIFG
jgi:hypothetical protein